MKISELKTPCYVIDEGKLTENLKILHHVMQTTGAKILLAQKAFSAFCEYPLIGKYLSGTTASGLYEARLAQEEMGKENHVFCPAYLPEEMDELVKICDHIVFNSVSQFLVHKEKIKKAAAGISTGLRINPECSTQEGHEIYDPCGTGSRLGITRAELDKAIQNGFDLSQIDGFHFHTLCEQNSDALETTLDAVEKKFGDLLYGRKWLNMGGGHHITKAGYDMEKLEDCIRRMQETYALEMPYRPPLKDSGKAGEKAYTYRLSSCTCLAGDVIGDYSFDKAIKVGDRLTFCDMAIYSMVKNNTFNGMPLPDIAVMGADKECRVIRRFGYEDFKGRLS